MSILADVHEPEKVRLLIEDISETVALPSGDYLWVTSDGKSVAIERKDIHDLMNSLASNRLPQQLATLQETYDIPILLVEGWFTHDTNGYVKTHSGIRNFNYNGILNYLISIQMYLGIYVIWTSSDYSTARWLRSFYEYTQKAHHKNVLQRAKRVNIWNDPKVQAEEFLTGLPGIGAVGAQRILDKYGSLKDVLLAIINNPEELLKVYGFGPKTVQNINNFLAFQVEVDDEVTSSEDS